MRGALLPRGCNLKPRYLHSAAARAGKSVLLCDHEDFYGSEARFCDKAALSICVHLTSRLLAPRLFCRSGRHLARRRCVRGCLAGAPRPRLSHPAQPLRPHSPPPSPGGARLPSTRLPARGPASAARRSPVRATRARASCAAVSSTWPAPRRAAFRVSFNRYMHLAPSRCSAECSRSRARPL